MRWRKTTGAGGQSKKDAFIYVFIHIGIDNENKSVIFKVGGVINEIEHSVFCGRGSN